MIAQGFKPNLCKTQQNLREPQEVKWIILKYTQSTYYEQERHGEAYPCHGFWAISKTEHRTTYMK